MGRGATDKALCLGHKEHCQNGAAQAGTRVRLSAPPNTIGTCPGDTQSSTQMPPLSLTMAIKGLLESPHGSHFGLSPVPSCSGNSRSLFHSQHMRQWLVEIFLDLSLQTAATDVQVHGTAKAPGVLPMPPSLVPPPPPCHLPSSGPQSSP